MGRFQMAAMLCWLFLWTLTSVGAQTPGLSVEVLDSNIVFGDFVSLEVQRVWPVGVVASPWRNEDLGLASVEVTQRDERVTDKFLTETIRLRGRIFSLDTWSIPSIFFTYRIPGSDDEVRVESPARAYSIGSALSLHNKEQLELPRAPFAIIGLHHPHVGILMLASILFLTGSYFLIRRFHTLDTPLGLEENTVLTLQEITQDLEGNSHPKRGIGDRVSLILRSFLKRRIGIPALELTPSEIREELRSKSTLSETEIFMFFEIMEICDEEKYGQAQVVSSKWAEVIAESTCLIEQVLENLDSQANESRKGDR